MVSEQTEHFVNPAISFDGLPENLRPSAEVVVALDGKRFWYVSKPEDAASLYYDLRYCLPKKILVEENPGIAQSIEHLVDIETAEREHYKGVSLLSAEKSAPKEFRSVFISEQLLLAAELFADQVPFETEVKAGFLHIDNLCAYAKVMPRVYEQHLLTHALNFCKYYYDLSEGNTETQIRLAQNAARINWQLGQGLDAGARVDQMYQLIVEDYKASGLTIKVLDNLIDIYLPTYLNKLGYSIKRNFKGDARARWSFANLALNMAVKVRNIPIYKAALSGLEYASTSKSIKRHVPEVEVIHFAKSLGLVSEYNRGYLYGAKHYTDPLFDHFALLELEHLNHLHLTDWLNYNIRK